VKRRAWLAFVGCAVLFVASPVFVRSQDDGTCAGSSLPVPGTDCDFETLSITFNIVETVVVIIEGGNQVIKLNVDDERLKNRQFIDFNRFRVRTGAITDYELFVSGDAVLRDGARVEPLPIDMLQFRLVAPEITGHSPVSINPDVTQFINMVRLPQSHFMWTGLNNTQGGLNTFGPIDTRVDLSKLPSGALRSEVDLEYTVRFFVLER